MLSLYATNALANRAHSHAFTTKTSTHACVCALAESLPPLGALSRSHPLLCAGFARGAAPLRRHLHYRRRQRAPFYDARAKSPRRPINTRTTKVRSLNVSRSLSLSLSVCVPAAPALPLPPAAAAADDEHNTFWRDRRVFLRAGLSVQIFNSLSEAGCCFSRRAWRRLAAAFVVSALSRTADDETHDNTDLNL
jgi:hypothetical protein